MSELSSRPCVHPQHPPGRCPPQCARNRSPGGRVVWRGRGPLASEALARPPQPSPLPWTSPLHLSAPFQAPCTPPGLPRHQPARTHPTRRIRHPLPRLGLPVCARWDLAGGAGMEGLEAGSGIPRRRRLEAECHCRPPARPPAAPRAAMAAAPPPPRPGGGYHSEYNRETHESYSRSTGVGQGGGGGGERGQ